MSTDAATLLIALKARDDASKVFKEAEHSASGLGSALGSIGAIAGGFVLGKVITDLPGILMDAAQAAADDAASVAKLQKAVENTGGSWADYESALTGVIDAGINKGFADDAQRDALSLLMAQTGNAAEAQRRLALAMDLSRGAGIDLGAASKLLGKVTDENVNVLAKYGISMKKGADEADLFGAVQARFGGQADTFAKSAAGQAAAVKLQMGEMVEMVGGLVLPIFATLTGFMLNTVIPALQAFGPTLGEMGAKFGLVLDVIQALSSGAGFDLLYAKMNDMMGVELAGFVAGIIEKFLFAKDVVLPAVIEKVQSITTTFIAASKALSENELAVSALEAVLVTMAAIGLANLIIALPGLIVQTWLSVTAFAAQAVAAGVAAAAVVIAALPFIAMAAAIGLVVFAVIEVIKHWAEISTKAQALAGVLMAAVGEWLNAGKAMVEGLWNGVVGAWSGLVSKLQGLVSGLPEAVKQLLGIHSPSAVFAEIGKDIVDGIAIGLITNKASVQQALLQLLDIEALNADIDAMVRGGNMAGAIERMMFSGASAEQAIAEVKQVQQQIRNELAKTAEETARAADDAAKKLLQGQIDYYQRNVKPFLDEARAQAMVIAKEQWQARVASQMADMTQAPDPLAPFAHARALQSQSSMILSAQRRARRASGGGVNDAQLSYLDQVSSVLGLNGKARPNTEGAVMDNISKRLQTANETELMMLQLLTDIRDGALTVRDIGSKQQRRGRLIAAFSGGALPD